MVGEQGDNWQQQRDAMVRDQLVARHLADPHVLAAMRQVPRHCFVPDAWQAAAYQDGPLPIGHDQTISQPYIVAYMTSLLALTGRENVLEIGTGSGYQTAILSLLAATVYSVERHKTLITQAAARLESFGVGNVQLLLGDGSQGLPEKAPFDAILITAAAPKIPKALCQQLARGGRLVVPVGNAKNQQLYRITRQRRQLQTERLIPVRFVPLIGRAGFAESAPFEVTES